MIFLIKICFFFSEQDCPFDDVPVILIGNKNDITFDRMVSREDGEKMCHDLGCLAFKELSVRENIDEVFIVNPKTSVSICFSALGGLCFR